MATLEYHNNAEWRWNWMGDLPPEVIAEAKAELSLEEAVADELMAKGDYGPEVEKLAREKMNRAIHGETGAARVYMMKTLAEVLGVSLGDGDGEKK